MKRMKTLLVLTGVFLFAVAAVLISKAIQWHVDKVNTVDEVIFTADADALTEVTWTTEDGTLDFVKTDGTWYSTDDSAFPVDQSKMADFLAYFASVHASFIIDDIENASDYGLDSPVCTLTFTTADGSSTLTLGGYSTMDSKRYVSVGDGRAFLVDDDLMEYVSSERDDFMQQDTIPATDSILYLQVSGDTSFTVSYDDTAVCSYNDTCDWFLENADGTKKPLDDNLVDDYLDELTGLEFTDYVTYTASETDLSVYGLDSPSLQLEVQGVEASNAVAYRISVGCIPPETETDEDGEAAEGTAYIRLNSSEIIYRLPWNTYEVLLAGSYNTLRSDLVFGLDWEQVTGISFTVDGISWESIRGERPDGAENEDNSEDAEDDGLCWLLRGTTEIDLSALQGKLDALEITEFSSEIPGGTQEFTVTLQLDNAEWPELTLTLWRYDGESCLAVLNGETLGLVSRNQMSALRESATAAVLSVQ